MWDSLRGDRIFEYSALNRARCRLLGPMTESTPPPPQSEPSEPDTLTASASRDSGDPEWQRLLGDVARGATFGAIPNTLDAPLAPGDRLGEYEVVEALGRGSFGTVYRARQPVIGKEVAVKVLGAQFSANRETVRRFINEARVVNQIRHPNIVDIFGFGELPTGQKYYVMQLLSGETLASRIKRAGPLDPESALSILESVASALDAAHAQGVVHRDLSAGNVFLADEGSGHVVVKLLDFGVARIPTGSITVATRTGAILGTPAYMAPEQCLGASDIDHHADIYALGVIVHEALTGKRPFVSKSLAGLASMHTQSAPPRVSESGARYLARLDQPVLLMLEKLPGNRPDSASAAIAELDHAWRAPAPPAKRRSRVLMAALAFTFLVALLYMALRSR